jgi:outer membrane protein OmpA-like peptidoglycan-associated protein
LARGGLVALKQVGPMTRHLFHILGAATLLCALPAIAKPSPQAPSAIQPPPMVAMPLPGPPVAAAAAPAAVEPPTPRVDPTSAATPLTPLYDATADGGYVRRPRLSLQGDYAKASSFLAPGDADSRLRTGLVVGFAPADALDLFGAVLASSNRNQRKQVDRVDPELVTTSGDVVLGAKGRLATGAGLAVSLTGAARLYAAQSSLGFGPTTTWLAPALTYDLRHALRVPVRLSVDGGYVWDHSASSAPAQADPQSRYVESFAHGVGYDRVRYGAALDAILGAGDGPSFLPYARFHAEHVTATADPVLARQGTARGQSGMALGLRAQLCAELALELGADVRLSTVSPGFGAPQAPLTTFFALTYVPDRASPTTVTTTEVVRVEVPSRPPGTVSGRITATSTGQPIERASVGVVNGVHTRVLTDPDGTFVLLGLPPGHVELAVEAPSFQAMRVAAEVPATGDRALSLALAPGPSNGQLRGHVLDESRRGVAAVLSFVGAGAAEARSAADGTFSVSLPPGRYGVRVAAEGHLTRTVPVDIGPNEATVFDVALRTRPPVANVVLGARGLDVQATIAFDGTTAQLTPASLFTLDEVADVLLNHPEKRRIRIEARTVAKLEKQAALDLTTAQATAVRDYLVGAGVDAGRLEPVGLGAAQAPGSGGRTMMQILRSGRDANRRVDFVFAD